MHTLVQFLDAFFASKEYPFKTYFQFFYLIRQSSDKMQQIYDTFMDILFSIYNCLIILNADSDNRIFSANVSILYGSSDDSTRCQRLGLAFSVNILRCQATKI